MSQNNESNGVEVLFTESPASWNTRYQTKDGFVCQLTIRAEKGKELLELKPGQISRIYREDDGYWFYEIISKGTSQNRTFDKISWDAKRVLLRDHLAKRISTSK